MTAKKSVGKMARKPGATPARRGFAAAFNIMPMLKRVLLRLGSLSGH